MSATMRLDRLLANMGYGSRREVQGLVRGRRVTLDGQAVADADMRLPITPDLPERIVSWGHFEALLVVIADLKLATPEMFAALTTLQRRLVRHDADLVSCITTVLRELRGEPPPTHWGPWLP